MDSQVVVGLQDAEARTVRIQADSLFEGPL